MQQIQDIVNGKKYQIVSYHSLLMLFRTCFTLFALCLFLFGFFPIKNVNVSFSTKEDIPSRLLNSSLDNNILYHRHIGKLVLVVIDAFRWDFVETPEYMPYVTELRRSKKALLLTARCHPPTATMPRIKAIMTGSIPNYVDVAFNLGSNKVLEDNLIHQSVENDLKVVFYGDELWLNLFPDKFIRKEGTTSFLVSDYTEVDANVTRRIGKELKKNDWDILILHYLGLDHIGHLAGPRSPLIPDKLREMDGVIKLLHESLQKWDLEHSQAFPSYLVVTGDHGMHDSGSHGGATLGEILASLLLIESTPHNISLSGKRPEVSQIDLGATLAVLLGLPIPKLSLGALIPHALHRLSDEQYLFALFYNAQLIANQFLNADSNGGSKDCFILYLKAQHVHELWLKNRTEDLKILAESLYFNATQGMSFSVVKNLVTFNMWAIVLSCGILIMVLFWTMLVLQSFSLRTACKNLSTITIFLLVGSILHAVSLSSSSFIEEEHQTWYFLWITFLLLASWTNRPIGNEFSSKFALVAVLLGHRFLRKLNQTGDKWASLPDISDWLEMPEHQICLTLVFLLGLVGVWTSLLGLKCVSNTVDKVLHFCALLCTLFYRNDVGDIFLPYLPFISSGVKEVKAFWFLILLFFLRSVANIQQKWSMKRAVKILLSILVLVSTLLLQPSNVILISYLVLSSFTIQAYFKDTIKCSFGHVWLGTVVYFYQGNSNNLATINVATGYIGVEHQNLISASLLVLFHTLTFPILALLLLWLQFAKEPITPLRKADMLISLNVCFLLRLLPLTVYFIVITIQREHLFIWSVFAPKLLYETAHSLICLVMMACGCLLTFVDSKLKGGV
ncbi:GPI ethanolamine phosphate transferase 2 isoform X2 [Thrips palmi]|uniref:GPI ethanolamine phosphate transferase 2 isoform X2 n=1 Tax=Thrips palmi TaxID=161013 RepID=A0A6P8YKX1_THRPL|nr:GPI ethanolamine phosphate transferase 2 isoform X2 [Thrips palmi]